MITLFDVIIPLGILLAMLFSKMPIKGAIAFCGICSLSLIWMDYATTGWAYYYFALIVELWAFAVFLLTSRRLEKRENRMFFRAMAGFFLLSFGATALFTFELLYFSQSLISSHTDYVGISHLIALGHVGFMMAYSDGIRNFTRSVIDTVFRGRVDNTHA